MKTAGFWETVAAGEYIMIPLCCLLIVVILIWWIRSVNIRALTRIDDTFSHRLRDYVAEGDIENAVRLCEVSEGLIPEVIGVIVRKIGHPMTEILAELKERRDYESSRLLRGLGWLRAISMISPMLGICGTIGGIADGLKEYATLHPEGFEMPVSAVIYPTLATTIAGFGVGIIAIIAYTCVVNTANSGMRKIDEKSKEFIDFLNQPA